MASLRRSKSLTPDGQTARFLYTILKQLDLKTVDWTIVAEAIGITNGHAARMRYSRFKQQIEGTPNQSKKERSKKSESVDRGHQPDAHRKREREDDNGRSAREDERDSKMFKVEPCFTQPWQFIPPNIGQRFQFEPAPQFDMGGPPAPQVSTVVKSEPHSEQTISPDASVGQAAVSKTPKTGAPPSKLEAPQEPRTVKSEPVAPAAPEAIDESLFLWQPDAADLPANLQLPSTPDVLSADLNELLQTHTNGDGQTSINAVENALSAAQLPAIVAPADLQISANTNQSQNVTFAPSPSPLPGYAAGPAYGYSYGYRMPPAFPGYSPVRPTWQMAPHQPFAQPYAYNPYAFNPNAAMTTPRTFALPNPNFNFMPSASMVASTTPPPPNRSATSETNAGPQG